MYGAFFAPTPRRDPRPYVNCNKVVDCHYGLLGCLFLGGGEGNAEKGKKFSEFHPRGGGKCSNPVPQCLGNLLNSPGSSVLGKSLGEIY